MSSSSSENYSSSSDSSMSSVSSSSSTSQSSVSSESVGNVSSSSSSSSSEDYSSSSSTSLSSISSESVGNVSSSSSSSIAIFNRSKPLLMANTAISGGSINNRLAQTILLSDTTYSIGKVYCYLMGNFGINKNYTLHMGVYTCSDDGKPETKIAEKTLNGLEIVSDDWYGFTFDMDGITPSNGYLSFVMWQDGGDEDNYVMWAYGYNVNSTSSEIINVAWISNDDINWVEDKNVNRAIKINGSYQAFDLENSTVTIPEATSRTLRLPIENGDPLNDQSEIDETNLTIKYPDVLASFIIDSSGSMGWRDRYNNRGEITSSLVSKFMQHYPSNFLFDFVTFGAKEAKTNSVNAGLGMYMSINLDANVPTRSTYDFYSDIELDIVYGDVYENNGNQYEILQSLSGTNLIPSIGSGNPLNQGQLNRVSGTGPLSIAFSSYAGISLNDDMIAFGFKNLVENHDYVIGETKFDDQIIGDSSIDNYEMYYSVSENPSIVFSLDSGPALSEAIVISATESLMARRTFANAQINSAFIEDSIVNGDTNVKVENTSDFYINDVIDIVDSNAISTKHAIKNINSNDNIITVYNNIPVNIMDKNTGGGRVQQSLSNYSKVFDITTIRLMVKDQNVQPTDLITFFLQSSLGKIMEWDFKPFEEWKTNNLFWIGDTAVLPITITDIFDNPYEDGTKVILEVDEQNLIDDLKVKKSPKPTNISKPAKKDDDILYVDSIDGYAIGNIIEVLNGDNVIQTVEITETGIDSQGYYIGIGDPLVADMVLDLHPKIRISTTSSKVTKDISLGASIPIAIVDITPLVLNRNLDPSELEIYDITPLSPETTYDDLNYDREHIRHNSIDIPVIDGYAVARVLPITEDVLKTDKRKSKIAKTLLRTRRKPVYAEQLEPIDVELPPKTEQELGSTIGQDYIIETPIYLRGGMATSSMSTTTTTLNETKIDGFQLPGLSESESSLHVRDYEIFPAIIRETNTGVINAVQFFDSFEVNFAHPITITSKQCEKYVSLFCERTDVCNKLLGYQPIDRHGVYAGEGPFTIDYIVSNKAILMKSGELKIKIYSSDVIDHESIGCPKKESDCSELEIEWNLCGDITDYRPPQISSSFVNIKSDDETVLSAIDTWRNFVDKNEKAELMIDEKLTDGAKVLLDLEAVTGVDWHQLSPFLREDEKPSISPFYTREKSWTVANQYDIQELTIPIVNGKARFELPANDKVSLVIVEASIDFQDKYECIRTDLVFVANPVTIGSIEPHKINASGNEKDTYEIGGEVTWKNKIYGTVEEGTIAEFKMKTKATPSVSATDESGWAGGVFLGPKQYFVPFDEKKDRACPPPYPIIEYVKVKLLHSSGYVNEVKRRIDWYIDPDGDKDNFYFKVDGGPREWSDGELSAREPFEINLHSEDNESKPWVGVDGVLRLEGLEQFDNLPRIVDSYKCVSPRMKRFNKNGDPLEIEANECTLNRNVGHAGYAEIIEMRTSYARKNKPDKIGRGLTKLPEAVDPPTDPETYTFSPPSIAFVEPLGIKLDIEGQYLRNGTDELTVVATVTWKGSPINDPDYAFVRFEVGDIGTKNCKNCEGDLVDDEVIDDRCEWGNALYIKPYSDVDLSVYTERPILIRTDIYESHTHACIVDSNGFGVTTELISLGSDIEFHVHTIENYFASYYIHIPPEGESSSSSSMFDWQDLGYIPEGHMHELRSVVVTTLKPTMNKRDIYINGYVEYDPTNCEPYEIKEHVFDKISGDVTQYPKIIGNRLMYHTYKLGGDEQYMSKLDIVLDIISSSNAANTLLSASNIFNYEVVPSYLSTDAMVPVFYSAKHNGETSKGFEIVVQPYYTSYKTIVGGEEIINPARRVENASRVSMQIDTFKAKEDIVSPGFSEDVQICGTDIINEYLTLRIKISMVINGRYFEFIKNVKINSDLQWLPDYKGLIQEATNDSIYISNAISYTATMGASPIFDAIRLASKRITTYQDEHEDVKNYNKIIFLLSDGDENTSQYSLNQALKNVFSISGEKKTKIIPIKLGFGCDLEEIVMTKLYSDTDGFMLNAIDLTSASIEDLINYTLKNPKLGLGVGTYSNSFRLEEPSIVSRINLPDITPISGTDVEFRYRKSIDGVIWGLWSDWARYTEEHLIEEIMDSLAMYFEYEIRLLGNEYFESPDVHSPLNVEYYRPSDYVVFFKPQSVGGSRGSVNVSDARTAGNMAETATGYGVEEGQRFVSSAHITHEADIPLTSEITYGMTQSSSNEIDTFYSIINPDEQAIMLTRYNERLVTIDNRTYKAINGSWPSGVGIYVYRMNSSNPNGILVNQNEYAANNREGSITFASTQNSSDKYIICIMISPSFRLACKITNYGSKQAVLHHVGVIYNVMKRIPTDENGNIIHIPIDERM